jgi:hypothetical protein
MAGLVPAIPIIGHCAILIEIAGTSPAMTPRILLLLRILAAEASVSRGRKSKGSAFAILPDAPPTRQPWLSRGARFAPRRPQTRPAICA